MLLDRRQFLASAGTVAIFGGTAPAFAADSAGRPPRQAARIRAAFLYPPSGTFANDPEGWWSWPGNEYDAEGRQRRFMAAFRDIEQRQAVQIACADGSLATNEDVERFIRELESARPDGLLLVMFYNRSREHADAILAAADKLKMPAIFYIGLGVMHGQVAAYRRPGLYFIQSHDNFGAIEDGVRMIRTKKTLSQSRLLSITEADGISETRETFLGITTRALPFQMYADYFGQTALDDETQQWLKALVAGAREIRGVSPEAIENAARAHLALKRLLAEQEADAVTMNCLRRGMLKPCVSFSRLNSELIPAACENGLPAAYGQMLGQALTGRPGFQHNPAFETEKNCYFGSHCTCPTRLYGPGGQVMPYQLRRFAHTNEGSCAIEVFWRNDEPVTMIHYYPDKPALDVYAGRVIQSYPRPPMAGCTTNVEIRITDREYASGVVGHHNLLFCGEYARLFQRFARLHRLELAGGDFDF